MDIGETVLSEIRSRLDSRGELSCEAAHSVAAELDADAASVGRQADEAKIRICRCQLGLFGHAAEKGMPGYKLVRKLDRLPEPASTEVRNTAAQGQIACIDLWRIGREQGLAKADMGNIVETLGIQVFPCRLGCFKEK